MAAQAPGRPSYRPAPGRQPGGRPGATGEGTDGGQGAEGDAPLLLLPPRWAPPASFAICLLALADSAYLTYAHYTAARIFACPISSHSFVNCAAVTTGPYSKVFGVLVAVLGLVWSAAMLALCSPPAWRAPQWRAERWRALAPWAGRLRLVGSATGVGMVFWLVYVELFKKDHLCEYCTVVHVLTVALFVVVVFSAALAVPAEAEEASPAP